MNVPNYFLLAIIASTMSCSSAVTLADMQNQVDKTTREVESAQEAMIELANMKEQYSEDHRDAIIKALKTRDKALQQDVNRIKGIEAESAQGAANDMADNLKAERSSIQAQMSELEKVNRENWQSTRDSINREIEILNGHIARLTQSLADDKPVK